MEIIEVSDTDLAEIEGDRHRTFRTASTPLTAEVILDDIQHHQRQRVIIICNTVSQAQGLFKDLTALNRDEALKITLLHSRFLAEHRAEKEGNIKTEFSEKWEDDGRCHVLIATQVIEAGLNITCQVMHAQLAPMNSLLQRAGRCARFQGERGEVYVYWDIQVNPENIELADRDFEPEDKEAAVKKKSFLPYDKALCELTWQVLQQHTEAEQANQNVGFKLEQEWIDRVHRDEDLLQSERRQNERAEFKRQFNAAIFSGDRSTADDLIRDVDNRSIFVWNEPTLIDFDNESIDPKKLLAFSVPTTALCKVWQEIQNLGYETDWVFKRIEAPRKKDAETYAQPICTTIRFHNDLVNSIQILVNPRYVHYDEKIGLLIGINIVGNGFASPNKPQKQVISEYRYRMDTYVGHLGCMWTCWRDRFPTILLKNGTGVKIEYASVRQEMLSAGGRFILRKIFTQATAAEAEALFEYLVLLAVFTHDLGKLQQKWQDVMRGWQAIAHAEFAGKHPKSHLLAHTDFDPTDEKNKDSAGKTQKQALKAYEKRNKRPNHAIESAFLSREILKHSLMSLLRDRFDANPEQIACILQTVVMAAGRHHSAWTKGWEMTNVAKVGKIVLHPEAQNAIASSWRSLTRFLPDILPLPDATPNLSQTQYDARELDLNKFSPAQIDYLQLYSLVVRALRLCDQRSVNSEQR